MNISVIGSGAWGTALSLLLLENGHSVTLWSYYDHETQEMKSLGENHFLPGVPLRGDLILTSELDCTRDAEAVVLATPSFAVRETAERLSRVIGAGVPVVSVAKGIERGSDKRLSEVISEVFSGKNPVCALSGPSHAEEVARQFPTAVVAASQDVSVAERVQDLFMNSRFRVYTTDDIIGVELSGALKNVIALCAGCCDGMGFGDNTLAMLMTRGLAEISRLGLALGGRPETFAGLAGMGDLIVTCTSRHSRNRRAGVYLGQGLPPKQALERVGAVVEGYYAARAGLELAQHSGAEMPITEAIYEVLYNEAPLREAFESLMSRDKKPEKG
ncbi:MAG: NAD(P)-dependent glycerol-3-phosphate dehydrogenase [Oscillospiraceae bacterium]|jgi:glycerol-3-phosphate dehydrogenase (NAD(P)+)|nr:NAD(P)-dependent glycerol-3-phosphate dehydrogenase [Oscillospiraceae bacterium]